MARVFSYLFLAIFLIAGPAWARTVKVAVDATWPPMEYLDESNRIVGCDIDFMRAVAAEAGFDVTFENVAWNGIFEGLTAGRYDAVCSSVAISEERRKVVDFSLPYLWDKRVRQALLVPKGSAARTLADLKGLKVGVQVGTTGYETVKRAEMPVVKTYDDIEAALADLMEGRIDGVVCDDPVASALLQRNKERGARLEIGSFSDVGVEYYGVAVKKGDKELLDTINKGIEAIQAKGVDVQIRKKWMGD